MSRLCPVCNSPVDDQASSCSCCGFKFLGATQQFKPISLDESFEIPANSHASATLQVVRGPQTGITIPLTQETITIGRSPQCSLFLNDMTVSREHASVSPGHGGYIITDDNSFNGVWVNNKSVVSHLLAPGDIIQIGSFCLIYQED